MKALLDKLHARMGDFWWYSLMLFCACRAADLLNAFVGLWLVPKYVDPSELGAVTPLGNFAGLLALPVAFAVLLRLKCLVSVHQGEDQGLHEGRHLHRLRILIGPVKDLRLLHILHPMRLGLAHIEVLIRYVFIHGRVLLYHL